MRTRALFLLGVLCLTLLACTPVEETQPLLITLIADGSERAYRVTEPVTVIQFLREVDVELGPLDRVNPQEFTQISDGMRITVVRVSVSEECEDVEIPYRQRTQPYEGLPPGEQRVGQAGRNGTEQICYRITYRDGQVSERVEIRRTITLAPQDEIIFIGPSNELEPVPITGTLAYINNNNAWVMRGSSTTKRQLTVSNDLDGFVFSLSPDGRQLLFSRRVPQGEDATSFNQLWLISDVTSAAAEPIPLPIRDVLYAEWVPRRTNTIGYSTGEAHPSPPGWDAFNDFWIARIDPQTGDILGFEEVLEESTGGLSGWWGMQFAWSHDGERLAWIQANAIGLVDLENNTLGSPLITFPSLSTLRDWSWRTSVSWSPDSTLLVTTIHGPPVGSEPPETSPVFHITVTAADGSFNANLVERAGIWSSPRFSPEISSPASQFPRGYIAYLRARDWDDSIRGEYDLIVADRDGSNARIIFPEPGLPGLVAQQFAQDFVWSPDGRQIAFVYQGDLWVVDVETRVAHRLTQDNGASSPAWAQ